MAVPSLLPGGAPPAVTPGTNHKDTAAPPRSHCQTFLLTCHTLPRGAVPLWTLRGGVQGAGSTPDSCGPPRARGVLPARPNP